MTPNHEDLWRRIQELPIDDGSAALPFVRRLSPKRSGKVLPSRLVLRLGAGTQCPVCKDPLKKNLIACPRCMAPQHSECWVYAGGCSTYSCGTRRPNVRRLAPPLDPPAPDRPPLHTYPALQALVAALVLGLIVALVAVGYGLTKAAPRFAVLPKHDNYRPVMVPDRWTPPPPREDVWHSGLRPCQPRVYNPALDHLGMPELNPQQPVHLGIRVDPWGRPVVPDPWGGRSARDEWGRPVTPDPWGRPSVEDPVGWPGNPSRWTSQPGIPGTDLTRGHDPTLPNPWISPKGARSYTRQPGYPPYGPTPSQHRGFGPSPVPPWNHRR